MPLFELVFKVIHDCPYGNFSRKFPTMKFYLWCNGENDVIEVASIGKEDYDLVMEELEKFAGIKEQTYENGHVHLIVKQCSCQYGGSISEVIDEFRILHLSPVILDGGWEYFRVIVFRHENIDKLFQRFDEKGYEYEIVRKAPFDGMISSSLTLTADALFSSLTEKQQAALITAHSNGYYRFPRQTNVKNLAAMKRIPRTTFQEHLQKAESKLVSSLVPFLQLYVHLPTDVKQRLVTTILA
ncbi:MAG: helix-turn-helix domain-containing protein [Candidatus Hermodarchaeota archaeon]|jgi:predicted DNA binding protein|nr:helix-turn-helix domain-containing protein [Candidatus Hermodarchaeota archaeon]